MKRRRVIVACVVASLIGITAASVADETRPDITVAPCSDFATHRVPAHTRSDVCVASDGTLKPALVYGLGMVASSPAPHMIARP